MLRRHLVRALAGAIAILPLASGIASGLASGSASAAEAFPSKPVTLVVPYPPGGGTDTMGRAVARALSNHWNKPVVVDNVAGADGSLGTQKALLAPPDGHTIVMQINQMLIWKMTMPHLKTDLMQELSLISMIGRTPTTFAVSNKLPVSNMKEFAAYCKSNPCQVASATRLAELIGRHAMSVIGIDNATSVAYKGTAPMLTDLLGGHITMALPSVPAVIQQVRNGNMKLLAVGASERFKQMQDVPTLKEQGYAVTGDAWYGLMVSRNTPAPVLAAIVAGVRAIATDPQVLQAIDTAGAEPVFSTSEEFTAYVRRESAELDALMQKFPPEATK